MAEKTAPAPASASWIVFVPPGWHFAITGKVITEGGRQVLIVEEGVYVESVTAGVWGLAVDPAVAKVFHYLPAGTRLDWGACLIAAPAQATVVRALVRSAAAAVISSAR